jgi:hypothetical protein
MNEPIASDPSVLTFAAPASTTEATGIVSFEVRFLPKELTTSLVGFTAEHQQAAEFRTQLDQTGGFSTLISRGDSQIQGELQGEVTATGQINLRGSLGGQEFEIYGARTDAHTFDAPTITPSDEHRYVLQPWAGLTSALQALNPTDHATCQGCLLLGAVVTQSAYACVGGPGPGDPGACSVLIDSWSWFQNICDPPPCM